VASDIEVRVPDIGDFDDVEIVEVLVAAGDRVAAEDSLVTLESDKASMEIPSPRAGVVKALQVSIGDRVSEGSLLLVLAVEEAHDDAGASAPDPAVATAETPPPEPVRDDAMPAADVLPNAARLPGEAPAFPDPVPDAPPRRDRVPHASPMVRGMARELGVELRGTTGSGRHGRILAEDVKAEVRNAFARSAAGARASGGGIPAIPEIDFARFGDVEVEPLERIRRVAAANLTRSWLNVPHVTQHDEADVTELEAFRREHAPALSERGVKLTLTALLLKVCALALRRHPDFRSSLTPDGQGLIVKHYYHLGVAVDTERGLVVPVVREVDRKGLVELAEELAALAERARSRALAPADLQGACFTISSLGGIGGTAFTPIVNAPEVAVLGVSRMATRPVWRPDADSGGDFVPRLMLPLSLSYDHRVIDGAAAVRFTNELRGILSNLAQLLL